MNWGDNLPLGGAVRRRGWGVLSTQWKAMNKVSVIEWGRRRLAPRLRRGDIVVLDNLAARQAPEVDCFMQQRGATLKSLPPSSPACNPIEPAWSLVTRHIRDCAPRTGPAVRRVARAGRYAVTPSHGRQYFAHAGYVNSRARRD